MRDCILALDAGTMGLKATLFTREGEAIRTAISSYEVQMPYPGWAQQPALWYINAAIDAVGRLVDEQTAGRVAAIGISGTMSGCIPVDGNGEAIYSNIIHTDARANAQLDQIRAVIDDAAFYARTGNPIDAHYMLPKILWLRDTHPKVFRRARWFINTKDVLYGWLTGRHGVTDYSEASMTGALDLAQGIWDEQLLRALDIDPAVMPDILPAGDVSGVLTREAAQVFGLPQGLPVAVSAGDAVCAAHGAGLHAPGQAYMHIGFSAWLGTLCDAPLLDGATRYVHALDMDGRQIHLSAMVPCAGAALDWAVSQLLAEGEGDVFARAQALAESISPGAGGVFFLPALMGQRVPRQNIDARGTLLGMSLYHGRAHVARAAYEGVAQALHLCDSLMRKNGVAYDSLALVGGGAQSELWPQMLADMTGLHARVHAYPRHAVSLGAAMAAAVGVGLYEDYQGASRMARFSEDYAPDPLRQAAYAPHFDVFCQLHEQMSEAFRAIGAYQSGQGEGK